MLKIYALFLKKKKIESTYGDEDEGREKENYATFYRYRKKMDKRSDVKHFYLRIATASLISSFRFCVHTKNAVQCQSIFTRRNGKGEILSPSPPRSEYHKMWYNIVDTFFFSSFFGFARRKEIFSLIKSSCVHVCMFVKLLNIYFYIDISYQVKQRESESEFSCSCSYRIR